MGLAGKNVLVTGGRGFFGSHLVESLVKEGSHVVVVDQFENPLSYFNRTQLHQRVVFENCNIINFEEIKSVIAKHEINFVFHLAARATVETAYTNPLDAINSNVIGTSNVLESCRLIRAMNGNIEGVHVTSTDKVYGKLPKVDESKPISGDHPYEVSKASADLIARSYFKTYGLPVVVTRFGNVYGEGDLNFSRIVPGIMRSAITEVPLMIRSNGKYIRDYVYVKDVVAATLSLAKNMRKVKGEAFNVSSLENLSVIEVIKRIEEILNVKIHYKIQSRAINEIPNQSVNFNKIKKELGWKPTSNFKKVIPSIFEWYKTYFEHRDKTSSNSSKSNP